MLLEGHSKVLFGCLMPFSANMLSFRTNPQKLISSLEFNLSKSRKKLNGYLVHPATPYAVATIAYLNQITVPPKLLQLHCT